MDLTGKTVLVVGSGISGVAATELLKKKNVNVVLFDGNKELDLTALREKHPVFADVKIILGELTAEDRSGLDLVVLSPGVPTDLPMVEDLKKDGIPIWGEIELAYHFAKGRIVAITGTNGKTTTTALCGEIMANYYRDVKVVGNIGIPYTSVAADTTDETVTVAEISSFQLETIHTFHPAVSAILNITPDHLNRHHTMECYIKTKERIAENQTEDEVCVLNYEDEVLRAFGETLHTNVLYFSSRQKLDRGLYLDGEDIYYVDGENTTKVINVNELNILGTHNYENVMAATGMALSLGVPMDKIVEVLKRFQAVEHRIEYVTEKRGVKFYNDSIASSPSRTIAGLRSFKQQVILIAGGYDKHIPFDVLGPEVVEHVKLLILCGATADKIRAAVENAPGYEPGKPEILDVTPFERAVETARDRAEEGDIVTLSPACAAFDQFKNFMERGKTFKKIVNGWE